MAMSERLPNARYGLWCTCFFPGIAHAANSGSEQGPATVTIELIKIIPSLIWPGLLLLLLILVRKDIARLFGTLTRRVEAGAPIKLTGVLEVGSGGSAARTILVGGGSLTRDESRAAERDSIYEHNRYLMLVHTLHPSRQEDQVYDILLYLVQKEGQQGRGGSLLNVAEVQYYFGRHWRHLVATSRSRVNGFAVKVSAYGPFLRVAHILFNDGQTSTQYRFVDFESPALQPLVVQEGAVTSDSEAMESAEPPPARDA